MKKILSIILSITLMASIFSVMGITASADDGITVEVGTKKILGNRSGNPDYYNDYSNWTLSDKSLAEISENKSNDCYITFLKPGRLVVTKTRTYRPGMWGNDKTSTTETVYNINHTIKDVKITDLDVPYHKSSLDTEAAINEDLQIESIKYTMFNKELGVYSEGDNIAIVVKVKCGSDSEYEKIDSESRAYWEEQKVYSDKTNIINEHEAEYIFFHTVSRGNAGTVENADFKISVPKHGDEFPKEATTSTAGIDISSVEWNTEDKWVNADKEYNVAIYFECKGEYKYAENFEENAVITVNGKTTELKKSGNHKYYRYYTETTIQPYDVVQTAHFNIDAPTVGEALPTKVTHPLSPGIDVKSVTWSPSDEKADANKEYRVTIVFDKARGYMWADDFEDQAVVSVNGARTELKRQNDRTLGSGKYHYYTKATIQSTAAVNNNTSGKTDEIDKGNSSGSTSGSNTSGGSTSGGSTSGGNNGGSTSTGGGSSSGGNNGSNKPTFSESYIFPFDDVVGGTWYYESVKEAHKMGLINGKSDKLYAPNDNMTFAEAVKLAVYMNISYKGKDPSKEISIGTDVWFSTFMKYALENGIIDEDLTGRANELITREEYVYIFSKALPEEAFTEKNTIPTGSVPDIGAEKTKEDKAIYLFYRAGILAGNDSKGTFYPSSNIRRSEVASILIRMMRESTRVEAPADLGR